MPSDYLAAHHVCIVEACGFNTPPVGSFPCYKPNSALSSPGAVCLHLQTIHVVTQLVLGVCLRQDICLCRQHNVKPPAFHRPDGQRQSKSPAIPDVECPDGNPGWEWGPQARQRRRCVQAVGAMGDYLVKYVGNPSWSSQKRTEKKEKPRIGYCRIYVHYFLQPPFRALGEAYLEESRLLCYRPFGVGWCPLACIYPRFHLQSKLQKRNRKTSNRVGSNGNIQESLASYAK